MKQVDIVKTANAIVKALDGAKPNDQEWRLIMQSVRRQLLPQVRLIADDLDRVYVAKSKELKEAVEVLINHGTPFEIKEFNA